MTYRSSICHKVWGDTREVFSSQSCAVFFLETIAGTFCSKHYHESRANRFFVVSGAIKVDVWGGESSPLLKAGDTFDVAARITHRFEVYESGEVWEIYYPDPPGSIVRIDDIVRLEGGGVRTPRLPI